MNRFENRIVVCTEINLKKNDQHAIIQLSVHRGE